LADFATRFRKPLSGLTGNKFVSTVFGDENFYTFFIKK